MKRHQQGFTLVEVLVALAIAAVALAACVRALGVGANGTRAMQERSLAQQAAENFMAESRLQAVFPATGRRTEACPQGPLGFRCEQVVQATPNPDFRRVTIRVRLGNGPVLTELDGITSRLR
ncbi:MAG TPA: type II secretion system minor pseudopilin GspI [Pusillimonas sp.]|jgi:general secretion pathway protein I|uniref:type II secretion system minor pseudopilin GspI n=1 Tax=unclassified Pusillimonas TaxID=2640016 RepID=UPI002621FCD3|nr:MULTISPECIES: type II secretion system minor pseudopilin GspI [unclassified Pusillimonas]HLU19696.1 type II secretion system minor pseudopilin GspI [Pusillimonas sp.]